MSRSDDPFRVPWLTHGLGTLVERFRPAFVELGRLETASLSEQLARSRVEAPIWVCGLARSGSTFLHLAITSTPGVATHRARDYPLVYTPYWTRQATAGIKPTPPRERAHGDRIQVTSDSPEALEEMVWMAFFPRCHDPAASSVLGPETRHPAFEAFHRAHLAKLALAEKATRVAAKANLHVARLGYLLRLYPDARFLIPVRHPKAHIASLIRQHLRFSEGERRHPRALAHMRRAGHFEFGLDRRPMNLGDSELVREIQAAWKREGVLGWALYWAMVHDFLADSLEASAALREACLVVRHEDLCARPEESLASVFTHCRLNPSPETVRQLAASVSQPEYYQSPLRGDDEALLERVTSRAASRWGYG
jgi:hypothetical protein